MPFARSLPSDQLIARAIAESKRRGRAAPLSLSARAAVAALLPILFRATTRFRAARLSLHELEDLSQDAALGLVRALGRLRTPDTHRAIALARAIGRNRGRAALARRGGDRAAAAFDLDGTAAPDATPPDAAERAELVQRLRDCRPRLAPGNRKLFDLLVARDLDTSEAAAALRCSTDAVRMRKMRLLRALRPLFNLPRAPQDRSAGTRTRRPRGSGRTR